MKPKGADTAETLKRQTTSMLERNIDEIYGLEPVIDLDSDERAGIEPTQFIAVVCPYCAESWETCIDLTAGSSTYVEDCQICCQPIEMQVAVADSGAFLSLQARRTD